MSVTSERAISFQVSEIGNRIKRLREFVPDRTQDEFAKPLGVSRGAVNNWERGKGISRVNIGKLSRVYGVGADWLMSGPDDGPIPFTAPETGLTGAAKAAETPTLPAGAWAIAIDETLRLVGLTPPVAGELTGLILQVATASPQAFPGMSAEGTTRLLIQRMGALILAKPRVPGA